MTVILPFFPTPWVWIPFSPITFGDSEWDIKWKNWRPLEVGRGDHLPKKTGEIMESSWWKVGQCTSKYICLVAWTRSVSQQKASQWFSLSPMRGFPSFCLRWAGSLTGVAGPVASSLDGLHHHLVPVGEDGSIDAEGGGNFWWGFSCQGSQLWGSSQ